MQVVAALDELEVRLEHTFAEADTVFEGLPADAVVFTDDTDAVLVPNLRIIRGHDLPAKVFTGEMITDAAAAGVQYLRRSNLVDHLTDLIYRYRQIVQKGTEERQARDGMRAAVEAALPDVALLCGTDSSALPQLSWAKEEAVKIMQKNGAGHLQRACTRL